MDILGLILTLIFISAILITITFYVIFFFKKKYKYSNIIMPGLFLESFVVCMGLTWSLILMNSGFNVNCYLNIDYTIILICLIPVLIAIAIIDIYVQKHTAMNIHGLKRGFRYILPALTILLIFISVVLTYFNINYYIYLNM